MAIVQLRTLMSLDVRVAVSSATSAGKSIGKLSALLSSLALPTEPVVPQVCSCVCV